MANSNHKKLIPNEVLLPEVARLISEGHTVTLTVRGNSMNPFLVDRRDSIVLGSFAEADLQPGIAVLARESTGRIVFHRIISRRGSVLTLQGDGNLRATEQADTADVMGIMLSAIRVPVQRTDMAAVFLLVDEADARKALAAGGVQKDIIDKETRERVNRKQVYKGTS